MNQRYQDCIISHSTFGSSSSSNNNNNNNNKESYKYWEDCKRTPSNRDERNSK